MSGTLYVVSIMPSEDSKVHLDRSPPLETLQRVVGGYIERIRVRFEGKLRDCYIDEDGWMKELPRNPRITALCSELMPGVSIVGPAAIWVPDTKGETRREPDSSQGLAAHTTASREALRTWGEKLAAERNSLGIVLIEYADAWDAEVKKLSDCHGDCL